MTNTTTKPPSEPSSGRQWLWFIGLWCGGLLAALTLGYTIKFLMGLI